MRIKWRKEGRTLYAELSGEIDQHCAAEAREKLNALLADESVTRAVFDMRGVSFMDSAGIGMDIINASRSLERILRMAGVYGLCTKEGN